MPLTMAMISSSAAGAVVGETAATAGAGLAGGVGALWQPDKKTALTADLLKTGKPMLVNFFASWCTPCLAEHPLLLRLKEREGVAIVGIAWKNKPEEARAWLAKLGDPFTAVGTDYDGKLSLDWGLSGVPETYLIDASGIVRLHYHAPITERDLNETILPLLRSGK